MSNARVVQETVQATIRVLPIQAKAYRNEILIAACVLLIVDLIIRTLRTWKNNYPPGPIGLPIVGYLPFLSENSFLDFAELSKKYGRVFSVKLGSKNTVVLNSADSIREAFTNPEILGRPPNNILRVTSENSAFFVRDNHVWREQRRFVVQSMKDLGLGKSNIEHEIRDEINVILDILRNCKGQPMDLKEPLSPSLSNNICALVFGKRYGFSDPTRKSLDRNLALAVENNFQTGLAAFFPCIASIPILRKLTSIDIVRNSSRKIKNICEIEIEQHKETFDPKNARDFIDSYIAEMESRKKKDPNTTFSDSLLTANVIDLFEAGSETVRTSILWCMYIIAAYPEVQKKVQKEILDVIGSERSPEYLDQKEMPYTHAVILETMRYKTIFPLNIRHCTTADTKVAGYDIPRGTTVLANFWAVHNDPKLWDDPESFKPERFLNSDGTTVVKSHNFMAFSLGKRACPGEAMASMEIFLYFTSLLQKFDVTLPEGVKPTFDAIFSIVYFPAPFKVCFTPQNV